MKRIPASIGTLILLLAAITVGCQQDQESAGSAAAVPPPEGQNPRVETVVIPGGTSVVASLDTWISTETNHSGDPFIITTTEPILVDHKIALPSGTRIHGVLRDIQASGRTSGRAQMTLAYETIVDSQGNTLTISALPLTLQAASATGDDVEKIVAGGVLGAVIGGITGGGKGAVIGAGAGAGAGTVLMLATKGDEVELEAGQRLNIQMTAPINIQVLAQR